MYFFAIRDSKSTASGQEQPAGVGDRPVQHVEQFGPDRARHTGSIRPKPALFTDLNADVISELKRLEVLSPEASADSMTGTTITVSNLTFDGTDETINDNLRIVKLTGGTITISSDPNSIPLSDKFKDAFSTEIDQAQPQSQTVNIADAVAEERRPADPGRHRPA